MSSSRPSGMSPGTALGPEPPLAAAADSAATLAGVRRPARLRLRRIRHRAAAAVALAPRPDLSPAPSAPVPSPSVAVPVTAAPAAPCRTRRPLPRLPRRCRHPLANPRGWRAPARWFPVPCACVHRRPRRSRRTAGRSRRADPRPRSGHCPPPAVPRLPVSGARGLPPDRSTPGVPPGAPAGWRCRRHRSSQLPPVEAPPARGAASRRLGAGRASRRPTAPLPVDATRRARRRPLSASCRPASQPGPSSPRCRPVCRREPVEPAGPVEPCGPVEPSRSG